jgi:bifunctional DNA-binding transcriptional regulator/antitoxin component of YhaV-PrlF toxin-antitoxin module
MLTLSRTRVGRYDRTTVPREFRKLLGIGVGERRQEIRCSVEQDSVLQGSRTLFSTSLTLIELSLCQVQLI